MTPYSYQTPFIALRRNLEHALDILIELHCTINIPPLYKQVTGHDPTGVDIDKQIDAVVKANHIVQFLTNKNNPFDHHENVLPRPSNDVMLALFQNMQSFAETFKDENPTFYVKTIEFTTSAIKDIQSNAPCVENLPDSILSNYKNAWAYDV